MGLPGASKFFGYPLADRLYVALAPRVDPDEFAADVEATFLRNGTEAVGIGTIMDEGIHDDEPDLPALPGLPGDGPDRDRRTAVVAIRAVRERRRQIGTLRAIGFRACPVGRTFAVETAFVAVEGTVIGAVLAPRHPLRHRRAERLLGEVRFSVPYLSLAVLLLGTVGASLLATVWPAISASRIRPAVALRMTD